MCPGVARTHHHAWSAEAGANIDEVHHQRAFTALSAQNVEIELVLQTRGHEHVREVLDHLRAAGFDAALY
jgi:threonine dehydratase